MQLLEKYKAKLKRKLADWLGITSLENQLRATTNDVNTLNSLVKCGVDVHLHQNHSSWAVVCLAGKTEYVNFVRLNDKDARDVRDFLKNFRERNCLLDMPNSSIPREVFWR
jgi:hypothetical protein